MRLINADVLIDDIRKHSESYFADDFAQYWVDKQPTVDAVPVVRCKDCRWFSQTTLGMTYACWHGAETVWGQTGEHAGHYCCQRIESENHYCGYGERKPYENPEED